MKVVRAIAEVRRALEPSRDGRTIGFVPTMGAFHDGHVALFRAARSACDAVVVSLFVNPTQFGNPSDLATYPRDEARDRALAEDAGVDVLFVPSAEEMYPLGYSTSIDVFGPATGFEGDFRPGHFRGVATVCAKLFAIVAPQVAFFGQKDAQQVAVIKQLVRDLNVPLEIRVEPTVRDRDGLALSSRNVRLSPGERETALAIPRALAAGQHAHKHGQDPVAAARIAMGGLAPEYLAVADFDGQRTLVVATRVGTTRLIDNVLLDGPDILEGYGTRSGSSRPQHH